MRFIFILFVSLLSSCTSATTIDTDYKILIHGNEECSYDYGDDDFCSKENQKRYKNANKTINFANDKVLFEPTDSGSLIVLDPKRRIAYPFGYTLEYKKLDFYKHSDTFCLDGELTAYRDIKSGYSCFKFTEKGYESMPSILPLPISESNILDESSKYNSDIDELEKYPTNITKKINQLIGGASSDGFYALPNYKGQQVFIIYGMFEDENEAFVTKDNPYGMNVVQENYLVFIEDQKIRTFELGNNFSIDKEFNVTRNGVKLDINTQ